MVRTKADSVPGSYRKVPVSLRARTHTHTHSSRTEAAVIVVTYSKEQICRREPRVSSSHPDLAEGHRGLFWRSPRKMEKENRRPQEVEDDEEAGGSGMSKASRKYVLSSRPYKSETYSTLWWVT
uniref:PCNA-associated factor n=1 Tax=Oreochromis niloticus TaxID=8128 RepID=A0A669E221_ORENI